jgi:hypothetical protein
MTTASYPPAPAPLAHVDGNTAAQTTIALALQDLEPEARALALAWAHRHFAPHPDDVDPGGEPRHLRDEALADELDEIVDAGILAHRPEDAEYLTEAARRLRDDSIFPAGVGGRVFVGKHGEAR